jgi:hypothetical protein
MLFGHRLARTRISCYVWIFVVLGYFTFPLPRSCILLLNLLFGSFFFWCGFKFGFLLTN